MKYLHPHKLKPHESRYTKKFYIYFKLFEKHQIKKKN